MQESIFCWTQGWVGYPMKGMGGKLFYCKFVTSSTLAKKQKKNQVESCPLSKIMLEFVDFVHALAPPLVQPHAYTSRFGNEV